MPDVRSPGVDGQLGEIPAYSTAGTRVPGELSLPSPGIPNWENGEDTAECPNPYAPTAGVNKEHSKVCGEGLSLSESYLADYTPLQHPTIHDELSGSNVPIPCSVLGSLLVKSN